MCSMNPFELHRVDSAAPESADLSTKDLGSDKRAAFKLAPGAQAIAADGGWHAAA